MAKKASKTAKKTTKAAAKSAGRAGKATAKVAKKATKPAKKPAKTVKKASKPAAPARTPAPPRMHWLDEQTHEPLIEQYARKLDSFIQTMADGRVDDSEIQAQEQRLVQLMEKVEPLLDDHQHAHVTNLLCEVVSYDMMQAIKTLQDSRPQPALNL